MSASTYISPTFLWSFFVPIRMLLLSITFFRISYWVPEVGVYAIGISILFFLIYLYRFLYIVTTRYTFNSDHIKYTRGILGIREDYINYYRIKDIRVYRSVPMRIIGVMEVTLITSDKSEPVLNLRGIPTCNVHEVLRNEVELSRRESGVYEVDTSF